MIRQLLAADFDQAFALFQRVIAAMRSRGLDQWDEVYPSADAIAGDIAEASAYAFEKDGLLLAYVCLNEKASPEYADVDWGLSGGRHLIVHRLCVDPDYQGRGFARAMMDFARNHAEQGGYSSIRLDAFTKNPRSLALYGGLGYVLRGEVRFRKGNFVCYDLLL